MTLQELLGGSLLYFLLPLWLVAGVGDYLCHRRTNIEQSSGIGEAALHLLQAVEVGLPIAAGLFLEINALVLAIMLIGVAAHTATALWDGSYSNDRRYISAFEQHIHSHLEYIPIAALLIVALPHWEQFQALFGAGSQPASFALRPKARPLPAAYVLPVAGVIVVQGALLLEEFLRCWRHAGAASRAREEVRV